MKVYADGLEGFAKRSLARARKLDKGEHVAKSVSITFADPKDMLTVLSAERVKLVQAAKLKPMSITDLAIKLKREPRAIRRDVLRLEKAGVVKTYAAKNPGHGTVRIVEPVAAKISLTAVI